ncbi:hypothetical protein HFO56_24880 [Rhizobium laguerreae]|uniref:hypothetical protein n=1 Tax=Rhizobium laguerreae TaxID=1076926 RepID=UPI001C912FFD|nr:hypothetical protein [Rhizobium laguerreae]MBY3155565.1 hypothetical protein [Rhizobium laguerreae]
MRTSDPPALEQATEEVPEGTDLLAALASKREAAVARIADLEAMIGREAASIANIDAVMTMYDPLHQKWAGVGSLTNAAPIRGKTQNSVAARRGQGNYVDVDKFFGPDRRTEVVKQIMADAARPMSSAEIADAYVALKDATLDKGAHQVLVSRISAILSRLRNQGRVKTVEAEGWKNSWRLS